MKWNIPMMIPLYQSITPIKKCGFPKFLGYPKLSSIYIDGNSLINHPAVGYPHLWRPPYMYIICIYIYTWLIYHIIYIYHIDWIPYTSLLHPLYTNFPSNISMTKLLRSPGGNGFETCGSAATGDAAAQPHAVQHGSVGFLHKQMRSSAGKMVV